MEQGWTLLASATHAVGARAAADCAARRDLIALAKLRWLAYLAKGRPRLAAAGLALEEAARRPQDFTVRFSSEIEAPDRFFGWNRGRGRTRSEVRLENGSTTASAPLEEEFTYPLPDDPKIVEREITIENDPGLSVTLLEVGLSNASSEVFAPAGVSVKPELRLQFQWPEEHASFGLEGAGGIEMTFAIDPTRPAPLGFWATHFDELHQDEKKGEEFLISRWETNVSGDPFAVRTYSRRGGIEETTTITISFEPKP